MRLGRDYVAKIAFLYPTEALEAIDTSPRFVVQDGPLPIGYGEMRVSSG